MSIFKDTFRRYVRDQLSLREELIAIGNNTDRGIRANRNSSNEIELHSDNPLISGNKITLPPGAFYNYTLNRQCVIRMTSLVDYVENVNLEVGGLEGEQSFTALKGASLSQNFILEGGVLSDFARNRGGNREVRRVSTPRDSFPRLNQKTNLAYGDFAIASDADSDGFGIVPMPGITNANIRTKSAYGSLREAKVNFECHNRRQLEILEMLYMRPGYMVALEWGWNPYLRNDGTLITDKYLLEDYFNDGNNGSRIYTNNITQQEVFNAVNYLKEYHSGNYDGFLGFVKNFGFQARDDGGFTCYTELVSIGEVLETLRIPNMSITNPIISVNKNPSSSPNSSVVIKTLSSNTTSYVSSTTGTGVSTTTYTDLELDESDFNSALSAGIFPEYNGLLGLTKSLLNYSIFNDFTQENGFGYASTFITEYEEQQLNSIFEFNNDNLVNSYDANDTARVALEAEKNTAKSLANDANYQGEFQAYLRDLVRYQSSDIENYLIRTLDIGNPAELRNYIIPINDSSQYARNSNRQPYIRWDALCALINENFITKDAKGNNPVLIVPDRVYDSGNNNFKLDPLLYCAISDFTRTDENNIFDYSCDGNVCILPVQFELGVDKTSGIDKFNIEQVLGYKPDISVFPTNYILGIYDRVDNIYYKDKKLNISTPPGGNLIKLDSTDRLRRIGNIFLNLNMINDIAEKNADDEEYTLGRFINDIWDEVNKVCPNHNFVVTDDKESNTVFIIDLPVDSSEVPNELHQFIPFSNKNILRKFEFTSNVPKALSATVAIQAQDPRSIQDIDGVTFAAFNRSIKNRILSNDTRSNWSRTRSQIRNNLASFQEKQVQLKIKMKRYLQTFFQGLSYTSNDKNPASEGNMVGITKEYQKNATYLSQAEHQSSTFTSVIPLDFTATLDGISGVVIGNIFKVQQDRLPRAYANANVGFIVFSEDQEITAGQDWITNISGKMTILPNPDKPIKITGISTLTYAAQARNLFENGSVTFDSDTLILSEGQDQVTDIGQAVTGDDVYLKQIKDNTIWRLDVDGGPNIDMTGGSSDSGGESLLPYKYDDNNTIGLTFGFSSVRSDPSINNERSGVDFGADDNNTVGLFDSWANAGLRLGFIKAEGGNYDPGTGAIFEGANSGMYAKVITDEDGVDRGRVRLLPSFFKEYFNLDEENIPTSKLVTFIPQKVNGRATVTKEGIEYYVITSPLIENTDQKSISLSGTGDTEVVDYTGEMVLSNDLVTKRYINVNHCTRIEHIYYNIQFYPEAADKFLNGWVRYSRDGKPASSPYTGYLDTAGADDKLVYRQRLDAVSALLPTYAGDTNALQQFWMRDDVLAASEELAKDPGNVELIRELYSGQ